MNSSQAYLPSDCQGFVLLLTLILGIFLSALVARAYQSWTQSKTHSKILLTRLKIYLEAQAVNLLGLDSFRNMPRMSIKANSDKSASTLNPRRDLASASK